MNKQARAREIHAKAEICIARFCDLFDRDAHAMITELGSYEAFGEWVAQREDGEKLLKEWLRQMHENHVTRWEENAIEALADE